MGVGVGVGGAKNWSDEYFGIIVTFNRGKTSTTHIRRKHAPNKDFFDNGLILFSSCK